MSIYDVTLTFRKHWLCQDHDTPINCQVEAKDSKTAFDKAFDLCFNSGHHGQVVRETLTEL
jgi:hypothetical protein